MKKETLKTIYKMFKQVKGSRYKSLFFYKGKLPLSVDILATNGSFAVVNNVIDGDLFDNISNCQELKLVYNKDKLEHIKDLLKSNNEVMLSDLGCTESDNRYIEVVRNVKSKADNNNEVSIAFNFDYLKQIVDSMETKDNNVEIVFNGKDEVDGIIVKPYNEQKEDKYSYSILMPLIKRGE